MGLIFITGNRLKFAEISAVIDEVKQVDLDLPEIQEIDPRKIIEAKLETAVSKGLTPVMVEDTSLYFESLNGLPGPLIKWFLKAVGTRGVYELAVGSGDTRAVAKTVIGIARALGQFEYFEGSVDGEIVAPRGTELGWNSIFQPSGSNQTFGEMTDQERLGWSMRRIAAEKLRQVLNT
jgi:inosine triphosphate pyrophosphatase